ncbi:MAG: ATPase, T2SS/T4P/T4SS family [Clostridia bacterium]|nr:ATPase, T2SS/T4P/T4SS family [Clostridia bacterium]
MSAVVKKDIDEILLESGILSIQQLKKVWDNKRETNKSLEEIILELGLAKKKDILLATALKSEVEFIDLENYEIDEFEVCTMVGQDLAYKYILIPVEKNQNVLSVAMKDPTDIYAIDDLRISTSMEIKPLLADPDEIKKLIEWAFEEKKKAEQELKAKKKEESKEFKERVGNLMLKAGVISEEQIERALEIQRNSGGLIGEILVKEGFVERKTLFEFLEIQLGIPQAPLEDITISEDVLSLVSEKVCRRHTLIPFEKDGISLKAAMADPMNIFSIDDLRLVTGLDIIPYLADPEQINALLDKYFQKPEKQEEKDKEREEKVRIQQNFEDEIKKVNEEIAVEIKEIQQEEETINISDVQNAPIVKMVNIILNKAIVSGASDIHIEPQEDQLLVRYRIDGQLVEAMKHDRKIHQALVARIKIISGLNIAEKRVPQDGRITMKIEKSTYDLRVSVLPTMFGEKVVIRIQDKEGFNVSKKQLGFFDDDLEKFDEILAHPHGIVLVTGPTGSGKSTTLYTALRELCKPNVNIMTVEDPVESTIKGINQVHVNVKAGMTFATALRAFLRQDPDIIMVGEIRDAETAEIATRAAITGHLVLSTLHTNDAPSSITRIIDMGIEPYLISSSIVGVIAQRLVRRLCPKCKQEYEPGINEREALKMSEEDKTKIFMPGGCPDCNNTGYRGRIAVYEIMTINRAIREMIAKNATAGELKDVCIKNGMKTLRDNCARFVLSGVTSMEEMLRIAFSKD